MRCEAAICSVEDDAAPARSIAWRKARWRGLALAAAGLAALGSWILWASAVSVSLSRADLRFIGLVLDPLGIRRGAFADLREVDYRLQVKAIRAIQAAVLAIAPADRAIPLDRTREPADLARAGAGLCYDRSRSIEKFLRYAGFQVRHASLYADRPAGSWLPALLVPGDASHAVTEVRTSRGWMVVDSNLPWIGQTTDGRPLSLRQILAAVGGGAALPVRRSGEFARVAVEPRPFVYVYGLYSRHGRFYPPYNAVPDVNWPELMENLAI